MSELFIIFSVAGSIALFLFGLKLMSESLQKITGDWLQHTLSFISTSRFKGVLTGIFITGIIQSSSATTVMVVSFVNAGILKLAEAVGVIMGANIGTTLTAWIIAFFGFHLKVSYFTLPLIGIGIPLIFSNNRKVKNWGEMVLGFSLLFIALDFLKSIIPTISDTWLEEAILYLKSFNYFGYIAFFLVGTILTIFVRSSNAIFAIILVLSFKGWISFDTGAAMVLGVNVGTTIAANTAARIANLTAKRAALAHLLFNLFGVIWVLSIFPVFLKVYIQLVELIGIGNPLTDSKAVPFSLALFHTLFNVLNTLILMQFTSRITSLVTKTVQQGVRSENEFKLTHIKIGLLSTPDASLYQAQRETIVFAENVRKMFLAIERIIFEKNDKEYLLLKEAIIEKEVFSDRLEKEIANYLTKVSEGRLSETSSKRLRGLYEMIDDIESIADSCMNILNIIERKRQKKIEFPDAVNNNIGLMLNMAQESIDIMVTMLTHDEDLPLSMAQETEKEINNYRDILKNEHLDNLGRGIYNYDAGIIYNDIISQCERIGDFSINIVESHKLLF